MKRRFILTIFIVLFVSTAAVSALHFFVLRTERLRMIDHQLEETATMLVSSDLSRVPFEDNQAAETYFLDVLGSNRVGKIILIRGENGRVIYSSRNAHWLPQDPPNEPRWQTIVADNHELRILGVRVPKMKKTLQVGIVLDSELLYWRQLDKVFLGYALGIVLFLAGVSYVLGTVLLMPLRRLALYLDHLTSEVSLGFSTAKNVPPNLLKGSRNDEFSKLTQAVSRLTDKLRLNMKTLQSWTAMMAHEIRTPLTVIQNQLEGMRMEGATDAQKARIQESLLEMEKLNNTVTGFLDWTVLEQGGSTEASLHAIPLADMVERIAITLNSLYGGRLRIKIEGHPKVFAAPQHVEQAILNILTNSLRYSPSSEPVDVTVTDTEVLVRDRGRGIPKEVLDKLGQPFNVVRHEGVKGTGLGLAWVMAVLKRYEWNVDFRVESPGTTVRLYGWS